MTTWDRTTQPSTVSYDAWRGAPAAGEKNKARRAKSKGAACVLSEPCSGPSLAGALGLGGRPHRDTYRPRALAAATTSAPREPQLLTSSRRPAVTVVRDRRTTVRSVARTWHSATPCHCGLSGEGDAGCMAGLVSAWTRFLQTSESCF